MTVAAHAVSDLAARLADAAIAPALADRLAHYGGLLLAANTRVNLTGAKSAAELAEHLLDALTVVPYVGPDHVDVGSGGGLPAIALALAGDARVTMIEATAKKAAFLRDAVDALGLSHRCRVLTARAEVAAHDADLRERFASGTARAVAIAPTVAELVLPFIAPGGRAILQRGTIDAAERRALDDAALVLGGRVEAEIALGGERRLLLVRKLNATAPRFPRRTGVPAKRPLCV